MKSVGPENYPSVGKTLPVDDCDAEEYASGPRDDWNLRQRRERQPQNAALSAQQYAGGPGMKAKLNLALREHNGLVYTVENTMVAYGDTALEHLFRLR